MNARQKTCMIVARRDRASPGSPHFLLIMVTFAPTLKGHSSQSLQNKSIFAEI